MLLKIVCFLPHSVSWSYFKTGSECAAAISTCIVYALHAQSSPRAKRLFMEATEALRGCLEEARQRTKPRKLPYTKVVKTVEIP